MALDLRPGGRGEHDHRESISAEILLVPQILIGRNQEIESFDRASKELAVFESGPTELECCRDCVTLQRVPQRRGRSLIEHNPHVVV